MSPPFRLLVVHADPDVRTALETTLQAPDRTVLSVATVGAAADRLADVEAVVSGQAFEDGEGLGLLELARERHPDLPVVLVPSEGDDALATAAIEGGATAYLPRSADAFTTRLDARIAAIETGRTSESERFRALIEHSTDMVALLGPDGTFQYVSPSVRTILGYDPADLVGELAFEYVHTSDRDEVMEQFFEAIDDDSAQPVVEFRFRDAADEWRYIEARGNNRLDDPAVGGFVVNGRDVTERHERERELHTERALTEGILATIPDLVYAFDPEGDPIREDMILADIPGYSDEDLAELHPLEFVPDEDRDRLAHAIGEVLEDGEERTVESAIVTGSGERIPHEFNGARLTDDAGNVLGLVGVARDISERKQREQELELYESMVEVVGDGVYAIDDEGRYIAVNHRMEEMTGFSAEELLDGGPPREMVPESVVDDIEAEIRGLYTGEKRVATVEHPVHTKDGKTMLCETRLTLLPPDESGQFRGTVGSSRDITARKRRARELERQNERLEEFAAVVSHDLRNPLNVITGNLELLRKTPDEEHLEAIEAAAERMEALISDLLSLARQGRTIGQVQPVDLADIAHAGWEGVETDTASLEVDGTEVVSADVDRLCELFENLFRNAIDHAGPDVTVTVGPLRDGFYVADDGPGIPREDRQRVLDHGYTTSEDGTGLGLAIVQSIVDAHDWDLRITDSDTGGARFEVAGVDRPDPDSDHEPAAVRP